MSHDNEIVTTVLPASVRSNILHAESACHIPAQLMNSRANLWARGFFWDKIDRSPGCSYPRPNHAGSQSYGKYWITVVRHEHHHIDSDTVAWRRIGRVYQRFAIDEGYGDTQQYGCTATIIGAGHNPCRAC